MERIYTVEVIGFNATERILLGSVFGLSLKRSPSYRRAESGETAHLRLVDGAQTQAIAQAHERQREQALPVVVVGAAELPPGWFETPRPLHWARLFRALDLSLGLLTHGSARSQPGARAAPPRGERSWSGDAMDSMQRAITTTFALGLPPDPAAPALPNPAVGWPLLLVSPIACQLAQLPLGALHACGRVVEVVDSTAQAMARLTKKRYALILVDLALPARGAQGLCRAVAAHPGADVLPRILYRVQASAIDRLRAAVIDCEAFVATGAGGEELAAAVLRIASRLHAI